MKYNFYSHIHRYMRFKLSEFEAFVAKLDFADQRQRDKLNEQFNRMVELLDMHANNEDKVYHKMLEERGSKVQTKSMEEHHQQEEQIKGLNKTLESIILSTKEEEQIELGYDFYLAYTDFQSCYLQHLINEETVLMPEFRKLYTEQELRSIAFNTYKVMTQEQLNGMLEVFFPYINTSERQVFLRDIKDGTPEKFDLTWKFIVPLLEPDERKVLEKKYGIC